MAENPMTPIKPSIAEALRDTRAPASEAAANVAQNAGQAPSQTPGHGPQGSNPAKAMQPGASGPGALPTSAPLGAPGSAPPASDLVTLKIDGREVQVKKGTNLLEACLQNGVDVSYFCYHPGLSSPAVCRQCLVEVVGQPKLVPSCYTPVADKMEVVTSSPRVLGIRQQMLEFTLLNHPVDCPICDKAGECTLQKMYQEWDSEGSRSSVPKVHKPKAVDLGPTIVLDAERCILCTRCIRVCDEVAGQHQLEMVNRGDREILTTAPGQLLDNPYSLNTVDVCPVGALTSKDFRFTMRAWELFATPSVCPGCATGCSTEVHHAQGEIWRLVPRENHAVNKFWMCDEGRFTYKEVRSRRYTGARIGQGRGLPGQLASIDKAVAYAAERLKRIFDAGGGIGLIFGAQATNEPLFALRRLAEKLAHKGGQIRTYVLGRRPRPDREDKILRHADMNPNTTGAKLLAGENAGDFDALVADLRGGKLKAVWMVGEDVPASEDILPGVAQLFDSLELFICQAVHDTALVRRAQVQLPAGAWAEIDGTFTNAKGLVQRIRKAVEPAGDARSHLELISLIAKKAGFSEGEKWQTSARQAFLQMVGAAAVQAGQPEPSGATGLAHAEWGRELLPVQLRFAHSRG
jgi:NADH-quinone oxidoreductase subunit G